MLCDRRWSIVNARTQPRCCGEEKEHRSSAELPLRELTDVRRESDVYVPQERSPLGNAPERFRSGEQCERCLVCLWAEAFTLIEASELGLRTLDSMCRAGCSASLFRMLLISQPTWLAAVAGATQSDHHGR